MPLRSFAAAALLCALGSARAGAQARVELALRSPRELTAAERAPTTIIIAVSNGGDAPARLRPVVVLPPRWRILAGGNELTIAPRGRELWLLTILSPSAPPAGRYALRLAAEVGTTGVWSDSVVAMVPRHSAARIRAPTGEQYATTKEDVTLRYVVRNVGNMSSTMRIAASSPLSGSLRVDRDRADLGIGDSAVVNVTAGAPPNIDRATLRRVILRVTADGEPLDSAQSEALFVPPRVDNTTRRLPVRVSVRTAGRANRQVSPVLLASRGALDEAGRWTLDVDARGPGPRYSPFGERDHYRVALAGPGRELQLGDIVPEQSRLTEPRWQQFGASLKLGRPEGVSMGAFVARDRYFQSRGGSAGGSIGAPLGNDGRVALNGVFYSGSTTPGGGVASAAATYAFAGGMGVEAEGAAGLAMGAPLAGVVRVTRRGRHTWLDAQVMRADTAFPGPLHGSRIASMSGGFRLVEALSLHAAAQEYVIYRPSLPAYDSIAFPDARPSPRQRTLERSVGLSLGGFGTVDAVRRENEREGHDDLLRLTAVARMGGLSLVATGEDGRHVTPASATPSWRAGLAAAWSSSAFNANLFGEYSSADARRVGTDGARAERLSTGVSATLRVGERWRASMLAIGNGSVATGVAWDTTSLYLVDVAVGHDFVRGQSLTLHARSQRSALRWFPDQTLILLELGVPLSLRLPSAGSRVTGRVVDPTTGDPVPRALVRLGDAVAIADRSGRVDFPALRAGSYPLSVAATSGGRTGVRAPATLEVDGSHPVSFRVDVYRAARTMIALRRWLRPETPVGGRAVDTLVLSDEPPSAVTVTLVQGTDTLRREVNGGSLDLGGELFPGMWVASIAPADLPPGYEPRIPGVTFTVTPGSDATVTIDLVALQRIPRVLPGGEIKVVPPPPGKPGAPRPSRPLDRTP